MKFFSSSTRFFTNASSNNLRSSKSDDHFTEQTRSRSRSLSQSHSHLSTSSSLQKIRRKLSNMSFSLDQRNNHQTHHFPLELIPHSPTEPSQPPQSIASVTHNQTISPSSSFSSADFARESNSRTPSDGSEDEHDADDFYALRKST